MDALWDVLGPIYKEQTTINNDNNLSLPSLYYMDCISFEDAHYSQYNIYIYIYILALEIHFYVGDSII